MSEELPIFNCEAIKTPSGLWVLSKVKNHIDLFLEHEIFDGDYLCDNLYDTDLVDINENWSCIEFDLRAVGDGDVDIHNIREKKRWFYPSKNEFPKTGEMVYIALNNGSYKQQLFDEFDKNTVDYFKDTNYVKAWTYLPSI